LDKKVNKKAALSGFFEIYSAVGRRSNPKIMAMIAITNKTCISPAAE